MSMMSPYNYLVTVFLALLKDFFSVYGGRISCLAKMIFFVSWSMPKLRPSHCQTCFLSVDDS